MTSNINLLEQNRLLSQEVKRRIDQMSAINAVSSAVGYTLDLDYTLETAMQTVIDVVGADATGISLINHDNNELVLRAQKGWIHDFVRENPMRIPIGEGLSGQVIENDDVIVKNTLDGSEPYAVPRFSEERFRSMAMAPMHARGRIIGILSIMSNHENQFDDEVIELLRIIADTVGVALGNARLYEDSVEQRTRLGAVLDSTADGIIATDRNSRINLCNDRAEVMLNVREDDLLGVPLREAPIPDRVCSLLQQALADRDGTEKTFKVTTDDDRVLAMTASPVYVESQLESSATTDGWVIVLQDVTHQREAELARAEFIQAAAHDMRNPLSVTRSALGMLRESNDGDKTAEIIELAMGGVERIQDLIDDLLKLEHIESGYDINMVDVNLIDIMNEVVKEARPLIEERSQHCELRIEENLPNIQGDADWLKRALHNYLGNAIKYTPKTGKIKITVYTKDGLAHLEIIDNGPGIPQKDHARLFERFYRVRETQTTIKGSGLGLAIVKSVAEAHGGTVYVRSKHGEGSTFGFTIPLMRDRT